MMKASTLALCLMVTVASAATASPVGKVLQLLSDLEGKITAEGEAAKTTFEEFTAWCKERSANLGYEIKTGKAQVEDLSASIAKDSATINALNLKVEELSGGIATNEANLKAASQIRAKEQADFAAEEKELTEIVGMLQRAVGILQREMSKGGASMLQSKSIGSFTQALTAMVQASVLSSADANRLTALVQSSQDSASDEGSLGAPDAALYKGHSGDIIDTLEDLLDRAEGQLADSRKKEVAASHNFQMLKQSLEDEVKFATKDMSSTRSDLAASGENKAGAQKTLAFTSKELDTDTSTLSGLDQTCMLRSQDYEAAKKSRAEELKALSEAKRVLSDETAGAESFSYGLNQVSFLQTKRSALASRADLANFEAVRFVRDLARKEHSQTLAQLAYRMAAAMKTGAASGADPFQKVKTLIANMISRLEDDAGADASHKSYCDKELAETKAKQSDKNGEIDKLSSSIDIMSARSAQLKEEVAAGNRALADLAAAQADMTKLRSDENTEYKQSKADLEQGIRGVKIGLKILREYYSADGKAHSAATGAGQGIIGLLEVVESDFSKGLAEIMTNEESAAEAYDRESKSNDVEKVSKEQGVKYKTKESSDLDKHVADAGSDRSGVQTELDAVQEYLASLEKQCIAKPETYSERTRRREAEIAGLKEALSILEGESMLQKKSQRALRVIHTR